MEDCTICYIETNNWKVLPCCHKLCKKCYMKLRHSSCPYCRREFTYTKEEQNKIIKDSFIDPINTYIQFL